MWYVGQQVVCVRDLHPCCGGFGDEKVPVKGGVYTIRIIDTYQDELGFRFEEIRNAPKNYKRGMTECAFVSYCFRPVKKTNISVFQNLLAPLSKQRVNA